MKGHPLHIPSRGKRPRTYPLLESLIGPIFAVSVLILCASTAHASIIFGPVVNPANGHIYYMLDLSTWTDAEAEAASLGGHLVTVNDADEDSFIFDTFSPIAIANPSPTAGVRGLWLGLNDVATEGVFVWVNGEPVTYLNWAPGEPNNDGLTGNEDHVLMWTAGAKATMWNDASNDSTEGLAFGIVEVVPQVVEVDVKPGNTRNPVNPRSKGRLKVAILTTDDFDASTVDASTVRFGPGAAEPVWYRLDDVDYDGDWDLVLEINTQETGIACGDTEATLTGQTFDDIQITGTDFIKTVGCAKQ